MAGLLPASDSELRLAAAEFCEAVPNAPGAEQLVTAVTERPNDWLGVVHPQTSLLTLTQPLGRALAPQILMRVPGALEAGQRIALWPDRTPVLLLDALVAADPIWMAANAADILRATPTARVVEDLLYALTPLGAGAVAPALAMSRIGATDAPTFRKLAEALMEDPARQRLLAAL